MSRDNNEKDYFRFPSHRSLMGRVLFNYNRIFNGFGFIFLNPRRVRGIIIPVPSYPDYILKIFFYYFILHFNINNKNNKNIF